MRTHEISPTQFKVSDFLSWQREGGLNLNPSFQRRSVWKLEAKSYLIDTVVRGLPVPLIFLRERIDLTNQKVIRDVVDGQQRLRTVFAYVDPGALSDFDAERDTFRIRGTHNPELANLAFSDLRNGDKIRILRYQFSVQVLPQDISDKDILQIFARLNSTGQRLNHQELRNAAYFGEFKTLMYGLAYEQFDRWLKWGVLSPEQMTRMLEVELTSDLMLNIVDGLSGKSQAKLNRIYATFDEVFPQKDIAASRFRQVMDAIDEQLGRHIRRSVFSSEVHFFTLFVCIYDMLYGLGNRLKDSEPKALPSEFAKGALEVSRRFREWEVPPAVLDAVSRASADLGRRRTRLEFMRRVIGRVAS